MLSPGINAKEGNIGSTVVRSTNGTAAIVGKFNWGPAYQVVQATSENDLIEKFGTPDNLTADYVISGINFLKYGNDLRVVRALDATKAKNASPVTRSISCTITNAGSSYAVGDKFKVTDSSNTDVETNCVITEVGGSGSIAKVFIPSAALITDMVKTGKSDLSSYQVSLTGTGTGSSGAIGSLVLEADSKVFVANNDSAVDALTNTTYQEQLTKYRLPAVVAAFAGEYGDRINVEIVSKADYDARKGLMTYPSKGALTPQTARDILPFGPQTDEQYAFIVTVDGVVKESYVVSTNPADRDIYGSKIFMDDFFSNGASRYIFAVAKGFPKGFSGILELRGGLSKNTTDDNGAAELTKGWDLFADKETQQVGLLIAGAVAGEGDQISSTVQKHVASVGEIRQDCVVFFSPSREHVVNKPVSDAVDAMIAWRTSKKADGTTVDNNMNVQTSYGFFDANYKYQYDKYNDVNRWVPLSADMAGLCARTDTVSYAWMSPAGYNRGQILDVIKLAVDTTQAHRDRLYQEQLNPILATAGEGVILYGDKTATGQPTPFNRINVRRLSNMIKFDISNASKYKLFELNDAFTRADFRMSSAQYMDNIRTLGGVYDFRVVCDETNNTPQVIDSNEFVGTIYYKPARSINFITLNFVATSTGTNFDELIGPQG